jgi:hypothetical protein
MQMTKRIAIQLFGHLRTFRKTFESFHKNLVRPHQEAGYDVDIFLHTWDVLEMINNDAWHKANSSLCGVKVSEDDIQFIKTHYSPKDFLIEEQTPEKIRGYSMNAVQELRKRYETKETVKYDWCIMTRPDIFFCTPFLVDSYIETYETHPEMQHFGIPKDYLFAANNLFGRMNVADPRGVCEADLIWFGKSEMISCTEKPQGTIPVKYILFKDFLIVRTDTVIPMDGKPLTKLTRIIYKIGFEFLKILPYHFVHRKIEKMRDRIKR